jgi:hypothetical protein
MSRYSKTKLRAGQTPADTPPKKPPIRRSVGSPISAEEEQFLLGDVAAAPETDEKKPDPTAQQGP